jgi:hypothetical protein
LVIHKNFLLLQSLNEQSNKGVVDSVAQLVEQYTFNVWALGSSPSGITTTNRKQLIFKCLRFFISNVAQYVAQLNKIESFFANHF